MNVAEAVGQTLAHLGVLAGGDQGGGLVGRDLLGEAGAAQGAATQLGGGLLLNFVRQPATGVVFGRRFKALAQPGHRCMNGF